MDEVGEAKGGMILSFESLIHTLLSAISGLSQRGRALAASIRRNSPSVSMTLIHRSMNRLLSSRRRKTINHSSSIESP